MTDIFQPEKSHGVQCVHLISGEDIFGEVFEDELNGCFVVRKPVIPHVGFDQANKRFHVALMPLRPYLGDLESVPIPADKVIYIVPLGIETEQKYREFTSGLIIAPAAAIAGPGIGLPHSPSIQL